MTAAVALLAYAVATCLSLRAGAWVCRGIVPFADGPAARTPSVPFLVGAAGIVGAVLGMRHAGGLELLTNGVLIAALAACCYCDLICGIVPDEFTLVPLAAVFALALFERNVAPVVACFIVVLPFALAAALSKGRGLGWGDVKLAALVAAVLGMQTTLAAFTAACLFAAASAAIRRKRSEPIAFAPYLAGSAAIAVMLPVSLW